MKEGVVESEKVTWVFFIQQRDNDTKPGQIYESICTAAMGFDFKRKSR